MLGVKRCALSGSEFPNASATGASIAYIHVPLESKGFAHEGRDQTMRKLVPKRDC
jgi:hypothetical protein